MAIIKDSAIYVIGELLSKLLPFLMLPYLTRTLGVEGFGELSYYQTLIYLLIIVIGLSQDGAIARYYYRYGNKFLPSIVYSGLFFSFITSVLIICILPFFYKTELLFVILCALFQSLLSAQLAIRQCQKKAISYMILQFVFSFLSVALTIFLFLSIDYFVLNRLVAMCLASFSVFSYALFIFHKNTVKQKISLTKIKLGFCYILAFGLPLIVHQSSFFVKGQLDRIIIAEKFDYNDLGIYAAAGQLALVFQVVLFAINKAIVPYYYQSIKEKKLLKSKVLSISVLSLFFVPLPALIGWCIPEKVYLLILGQQYGGVKWFTVLFLLGYGLNITYLILVNYLFYYGKTSFISSTTFCSAVLYLIIFLILSSYSLLLLPISILISNVLMVTILFIFVRQLRS